MSEFSKERSRLTIIPLNINPYKYFFFWSIPRMLVVIIWFSNVNICLLTVSDLINLRIAFLINGSKRQDYYFYLNIYKMLVNLYTYIKNRLTDWTGAPRRVASATAKLAPRETSTPGLSAAGIGIGISMNVAAYRIFIILVLSYIFNNFSLISSIRKQQIKLRETSWQKKKKYVTSWAQFRPHGIKLTKEVLSSGLLREQTIRKLVCT